ncbi:MAG: hypothetical protein JKY50_20215 [Oleispira sp.]|nr:hypothetical protein [Oleispira sp.]
MTKDKENFPASWDEHYDLDKVEREGDNVFLHAFTTVNGRKNHHERYKITIKEALSNWVQKSGKLKTKDTVRK